MSDRKNLGRLEQIFFTSLSILIGRYVIDATTPMPTWVLAVIAMFLIAYFALLAYVEISHQLEHMRQLQLLKLKSEEVKPVEPAVHV